MSQTEPSKNIANLKEKFKQTVHVGELLLLSAITYYVRFRMQQYSSQLNKNTAMNQLKKKQAKFSFIYIILCNFIFYIDVNINYRNKCIYFILTIFYIFHFKSQVK